MLDTAKFLSMGLYCFEFPSVMFDPIEPHHQNMLMNFWIFLGGRWANLVTESGMPLTSIYIFLIMNEIKHHVYMPFHFLFCKLVTQVSFFFFFSFPSPPRFLGLCILALYQ